MRNSYLAKSLGVLTASISFAGFAHGQERTVNILNWSDYIDDSILKSFTAETGIKVVYDTFDTNLTLETKLLAGGSGYDVVVPTSNFLERQIKAGVFLELDKSKIPNVKNQWDMVENLSKEFDPDNAYSVNYTWGTEGIGYNVDKIKEVLGVDTIDSWAVIFDPKNAEKLASCGFYMMDAPVTVASTTLLYLGLNPLDLSNENLKKAEDALMAIRPYIKKFDATETISALANGDICIALNTTGWVLQARDRAIDVGNGITIKYVNPKEGGEMWLDQLAIPADAPHVEEAYEFINYMLRPDIAAKTTNFIKFANGNKASQEFIKPEIMNEVAIYPSDETMAKFYVNRALDAKTERALNRMYTRVVTGQ